MIECITIDTFRFLFCHIILAGSFNKLRCCFCCYTFSFLFVYFSFHSFVLFVYKTQYRRFYTLHDRTRHIRVVFMYILDFNCILWVAMPYSWTWTIKTVFIVFVSLSFFFFFWFYVHFVCYDNSEILYDDCDWICWGGHTIISTNHSVNKLQNIHSKRKPPKISNWIKIQIVITTVVI